MGADCCSLLAGKNCPIESRKKYDDVYACYDLAQSLKEKGWDKKQEAHESYAIVLHPCGRYTISSGQHRFCIMSREKMNNLDVFEKLYGPCYKYCEICDKYLTGEKKNLYLSDLMDYVVDSDGFIIYRRHHYNITKYALKLWNIIRNLIKKVTIH